MNNHSSLFRQGKTVLFGLSLSLFCTAPSLQAGLMHPDYDLQTYRDFAENRGKFAAGKKNIDIHFSDGSKAGTLPEMMSFESVTDGGFAALTGSPQYVLSVAHNGGYQDVSFSKRFGGNDHYKVVKKNNGWGDKTDYTYDVQVARLDKVVTEAAAMPVMVDHDQLKNLAGKLVIRCGGGTQQVAINNNEAKGIAGAYSFLTGGTLIFKNVPVNPPNPQSGAPAAKYNAYQFQYNLTVDKDPNNPLPIGVLAGDSGSAAWTYNTKTKRWEYMGTGQSGGGGGFSQMRAVNDWALDTIAAYNDKPINASEKTPITWQGTDAYGIGILKQGNNTWMYHGLPRGKKAAEAPAEDMDATRNLIFSTPVTLTLTAPIDMGAASLTFKKNAKLTSENPAENTLNSAGFIVESGATVQSTLTAQPNDEWRKIGKGTFTISGKGNNPAKLNIGEGIVSLNREKGKAAEDIYLTSGRALLRLEKDGQIDKPIRFGARGGTIDLNGINLNWAEIPHVDNGAKIVNKNTKKPSTFTYTGNGTFKGSFGDSTGKLNVIYAPAKTDEAWIIQGTLLPSSTLTLEKGSVVLEGYPTPRANNFIDPNDWQIATIKAGQITVNNGSKLTLGKKLLCAAPIALQEGSTLIINTDFTPEKNQRPLITLKGKCTIILQGKANLSSENILKELAQRVRLEGDKNNLTLKSE